MKHLLIAILALIISTQVLTANNEITLPDDPPSYTAPNGKTYTWNVNFAQLSVDYKLSELVNMPVWICCGNTEFGTLTSASCRKGILNSGIKPHQINSLDSSKTYTNSLGNKFTPDASRLRLYGFCMVEQDSRGLNETVDIDAVCDELRAQMLKEGKQPCSDLTPQNIRPDYDRNLIYYTVCGETKSRPMTDEFRRPAAPTVVKEVVKEVVNCEDDVVNLPVTKICEGETYDWSIDGKDYTYDKAGTYMHSMPKADNCGKTNTILNLDFYDPINKTIVPDEKFNFAGGDTYEFEGMTFDAPGTYEKEYVDANGCNAMATIVLQEESKQICTDCATNAKDLGNIELALRGNYGKLPVSPKLNAINQLGTSAGIEIGYWKDFKNKRDLLNGLTCPKNLFEYGIIGGLTADKLTSSEPSECNCNNASEGSAIHAYVEPGVRWHFLGLCDRFKFLPIPVAGAGLRMHYNDHNVEDISKLTLSPKVFAEGRWYFSKLFKTPSVNMASLTGRDRVDITSPFFAIGGEAFAPGFTFSDLNYIGYLKLGVRF